MKAHTIEYEDSPIEDDATEKFILDISRVNHREILFDITTGRSDGPDSGQLHAANISFKTARKIVAALTEALGDGDDGATPESFEGVIPGGSIELEAISAPGVTINMYNGGTVYITQDGDE